ncbi:hypothetical protein M426DRAFT_24185 [Hypoxylon sp. CI-4A]|nr:hypothetical protein M426DRAFT_24185 [Hypoxylon sp. CI-4A]
MMASLPAFKVVITFLLGLISLGGALAGPVDRRQNETLVATPVTASSTTTAAVNSTITGYAHPLTRYSLDLISADQTPLSYASPPTPITVPTRLRHQGVVEAAYTPSPYNADKSVPSVTAQVDDVPTATPVCTSIAGVYPTATIPNFCNPSFLSNAPSLAAPTSLPLANVTIGAVSNKLDCCVQCANIFNCVAWRFVPVYTQKPNAHLPGGFDPWGRGDCEAYYHVGDPESDSIAGSDKTANLCPNGVTGGLLSGTGSGTDSWDGLYYDGWNEGPCANPTAPFDSGEDAGQGDSANLCP